MLDLAGGTKPGSVARPGGSIAHLVGSRRWHQEAPEDVSSLTRLTSERWSGLGTQAAAARGTPRWWVSPDGATRGVWCQHEGGERSMGGIAGRFPKGVQESDSGKIRSLKISIAGAAGLLELLGQERFSKEAHCRRLCRHRSSPSLLVGQAVDFEKRQTEPRTNYITFFFISLFPWLLLAG